MQLVAASADALFVMAIVLVVFVALMCFLAGYFAGSLRRDHAKVEGPSSPDEQGI